MPELENSDGDNESIRSELSSLREIAKIWHGILESSHDAIIVIHPDGRIYVANEIAARSLGFAASKLPQENYFALLGGGVGKLRRHKLETLFSSGQSIQWQDEWSSQFFRHIAIPVSDGNLCVIVSQDITAQKLAEESAQNKRARLATLIETVPDLVWLKDTEGRYVNCNHKFELFFGASEAQIKGKTDSDFQPPDVAEAFQKIATESLAKNGIAISHQWITYIGDGHREFVEIVNTPFIDSFGSLKGVMGVARDVTAFKQTQDALTYQSSLYRTQLDLSLDGILVVDDNGNIIDFNRQFLAMWGLTDESLRLSSASSMRNSVIDRLEDPVGFIQRITHLNQNIEERGFDEIALKAGRIIEQYSTSILDAEGVYRGRVWYFRDITERKQLEAQSLRAQRLESIGTLASGIAHDFNNVLAPILMGVEVLESDALDEDTRTVLGMMGDGARRGAEMVKQLLTFARGADTQKGPVHPKHILREIKRLLNQTFPKNIQVYLDDEVKSPVIIANPGQLHQVLVNLCVNARDAMKGGGVLFLQLETETLGPDAALTHPKARPICYVVFRVSDSGGGIPAETLEHIFDPFFTTKPQGEGTGLGLATVLGIAEGHGGFVLVDSTIGKGTTFKVYFPAANGTESDSDGAAALPLPQGKGEIVLIIDDEPAISFLASEILQRAGYQTLTARSSSGALALYETNRAQIRLVLTDIMMPFGDGRQLIGVLLQQDPNLPIIAMSGLAAQEFQSEILFRGAKAFITKPFSARELLTTVAAYISG